MTASNKDHDNETFIADSGTTSNMVHLEENMTNLKESERQDTLGDSINLTGPNVAIKTHIRDVVKTSFCDVI